MKKQNLAKRSKSRFRHIEHPRIYDKQEIALSNAKVNIHIRLDADILRYFKEKANREGGKYQSLINEHLRETIFKERNLARRLQQIEDYLRDKGEFDKITDPENLMSSNHKEMPEEQEIEFLLAKDPQLKMYWDEHQELKKRLSNIVSREEEEIESLLKDPHVQAVGVERLQKLKSLGKDRIMEILLRHRGSQ
jgi:uncharacterized protein (DUF4415 family)